MILVSHRCGWEQNSGEGKRPTKRTYVFTEKFSGAMGFLGLILHCSQNLQNLLPLNNRAPWTDSCFIFLKKILFFSLKKYRFDVTKLLQEYTMFINTIFHGNYWKSPLCFWWGEATLFWLLGCWWWCSGRHTCKWQHQNEISWSLCPTKFPLVFPKFVGFC